MTGYAILIGLFAGLFLFIKLGLTGKLGKRNQRLAEELVGWWRG